MAHSRTASIRGSVDDLLRREFAVELAVLIALFLGVHGYAIAVSNVLDPYFLDSDVRLAVLRGVLLLVGMGALAAAHATRSGDALPFSVPDRTDGRLLGVAVAGTAALATVPFLLFALQTDAGVGHVLATLPRIVDIFLGRTLVRAAVFVAGMVLLYHGVVQGAFRRVLAHDRDVVVATTLLAVYLTTPRAFIYGTFGNRPWLYLPGERIAVALLFVLALWLAVYASDRVDDRRVRGLALVPLATALALAVLVLGLAVESPDEALLLTARAGVVGVAAYAYARTESLVSPTLVYATFAVVSTVLHSAALRAVLGA